MKKAPSYTAKCLIFLVRPEGFPYLHRASEPPTYRFVVMLPSPSSFTSCYLLFVLV
jgi:hypothetical protein